MFYRIQGADFRAWSETTEGSGGTAPPEAEAGGTGTEAPADPADPAPGAPAQTPWQQRRIDTLTAQWREEQRQRQALQTELDTARAQIAAQSQPGASGGTAPGPAAAEAAGAFTQVDLDRLANARAAEMVFVERCNTLHGQGVAEYKDFGAKIEAFKNLGGLPNPMLEAVLEVPNGHKVLYELAGDLNEASRIMAIPNPIRQAAAIATYAMKLGQAKGQEDGGSGASSSAPAARGSTAPEPPSTRVGGNRAAANSDLYADNVDSRTWMAERLKQKAALGRRGRK